MKICVYNHGYPHSDLRLHLRLHYDKSLPCTVVVNLLWYCEIFMHGCIKLL